MLFIQYDAGFPVYINTPTLREVGAVDATDAYRGRQTGRVLPVQYKKGTPSGFSNILAEEEDAILTRLGSDA